LGVWPGLKHSGWSKDWVGNCIWARCAMPCLAGCFHSRL